MRGAVKHIVLLVILVIVILLLAIPALRRMEPHHDVVPPERPDSLTVRDEHEPLTQRMPGEWSPVAAWEGRGDYSSPPFAIHGHSWRVVWETEMLPTMTVGRFDVLVYDAEGTLKSVAAGTNKSEKGMTALPGPGDYYVQINTPQTWAVKIEVKE